MNIMLPVFLSTTAFLVSAQTNAGWNTRTTDWPRHFAQIQSVDQQKEKFCTDKWQAKVASDKASRLTNPNKPPLTREDFRKDMADCLSNPNPTTPR